MLSVVSSFIHLLHIPSILVNSQKLPGRAHFCNHLSAPLIDLREQPGERLARRLQASDRGPNGQFFSLASMQQRRKAGILRLAGFGAEMMLEESHTQTRGSVQLCGVGFVDEACFGADVGDLPRVVGGYGLALCFFVAFALWGVRGSWRRGREAYVALHLFDDL